MNEKPILVSMDADHQIHLLAMLADYHTCIIEQWHCGERQNDEVAETCYLLGNIEGRLLYSGITKEDLEIMQCWEDELEEWKESNNGQICKL